MKVYWMATCWSKEREFFSRWLAVRTEDLPPLDRFTLEFLVTDKSDYGQKVRQFRHFFRESPPPRYDGSESVRHCVTVRDYIEGVNGTPITMTDIIREKEGNPNLVSVPGHLRDHDLQLIFSPNSPIPEDPLSQIHLSQADIDCLAYFVRDARELKESKFFKGRAPRLCHDSRGGNCRLEGHSDELLRSFVTVFRRLYMDKEPGNFEKACGTYSRHFLNKRLTRWVDATKAEYEAQLSANAAPFFTPPPSFSTARLLDVFIYTRYAHQPNERRVRQFQDCLKEVGDENKLVWMFCCALLSMSAHYVHVLQFLETELEWYLRASGKAASIACRPLVEAGVNGSKDMVDAAIVRRVHDFAVQLGEYLWSEAGAKSSELARHVQTAEEMLTKRLEDLGIHLY